MVTRLLTFWGAHPELTDIPLLQADTETDKAAAAPGAAAAAAALSWRRSSTSGPDAQVPPLAGPQVLEALSQARFRALSSASRAGRRFSLPDAREARRPHSFASAASDGFRALGGAAAAQARELDLSGGVPFILVLEFKQLQYLAAQV